MELSDNINVYNADCLQELTSLPDNSVDLVICDLPYGVTQAQHDVVIPMGDYLELEVRGKHRLVELDEYLMAQYKLGIPYTEAYKVFKKTAHSGLWTLYNRVVKENGAIILFGQDKFSAYLMDSNPKNHRYNLIWQKLGHPSGFLNANRQPLREHEDILVFYRKQPTYNPQKWVGEENHSRGVSTKPLTNNNYGAMDYADNHEALGNLKHPRSILAFQKPHPPIFATQKSQELIEWLIKSYSNEGDVVLDNTMGSGTTGRACVRTSRQFIGIEKDTDNYNLAVEQITEELTSLQADRDTPRSLTIFDFLDDYSEGKNESK